MHAGASSLPATAAHQAAKETPEPKRSMQAAPEDIYVWAVAGVGLLVWWLAFGLALVRLT
jgi:hypothetical protein